MKRITSRDLNLKRHILDGFIIQDNSPEPGYIQWADVHITYMGETYKIADGYTSKKYVYWDKSVSTSHFVVSDNFPQLDDEDVLVFYNRNGIHLTVPTAQVVPGDLIVPGTILSNAIATGAITAEHLAAGSVTAHAVAADAIGAEAIAAGVILAEHIASNAVTADKIAAGSITADKIASSAVTTQKIAAGAITADSGIIANAAIKTAHIQDGAITNAKISNLDAGKITTGTLSADRIASGSITLNKLASSVQNDISTAPLANAKAAMATGKLLYPDATFKNGMNSTTRYAGVAGDGPFRVTAPEGTPTQSGYVLSFNVTEADSSNRYRGFYQAIQSRPNAIFVIRFIANLPEGYYFRQYNNSMGTGAKVTWLTSQQGTGTWTEYVYMWECGSTGTFSTGGHVAVLANTGTTFSPFTYYVAGIWTYDLSNQSQLADWIHGSDRTSIDGGKIYAGTITATKIGAGEIKANHIAADAITADKIATDAIKSRNYAESGGVVTAGSFLNLADGSYKSKNTRWDSSGALTATSATIKGDITATSFTCVDSNENFIGGIIQDEHGNSVLAARMLVDPDNIASVFVGSWSSGEMSVPAGVKMSTSNKVFFEANDYFTRLKASGGTAFITISAAHSNSANIVLNAEMPSVYMQVSSGENEKSRFELSPMLTRLITQDGIPIDISSVSGSYNGNMTLSSSNITLSVENTSTSGGSITLQYHSRDLLATAAYIKVNPTNIELYGLGGVNVSGSLIPSSGGFYNLGTSEYRWNYLYATYLNISGSSTFSGSVSISGTTTLSNSLTARNIYFAADNTYEIGSSSVRPSWVRCVYLAVRTYISGTTAITGNFRPYQGYSPTLGTTDYVWDTIYCNKIGTTLVPNTVSAWDLGNSSLRFRTIYATNPLNTSDIRIKSDIREVKGNVESQKQNMQKLLSTELQITDADIIDFIEKLNVYTYVLKKPKVTYKEVEKAVGDNEVDIDKVPEVEFLDQTVSDALADNRMEDIQLGLLANELENHVLYPYIGYKDTINNEKHLALKYNGLTVAALKAIQILLKRINSLENKIQ